MRGQNLVEKERLGARQFQSEVPIVLTLESNDPAWGAWYPRQTINMTCAFQCGTKFVFSYHDTKMKLEWKTEWLVRARNVVSITVLVSRGPRSFWTASLSRPLREQTGFFRPRSGRATSRAILSPTKDFFKVYAMKTDTVPFPNVSVLERVDCVFLLMTFNTHCRCQCQWNKQTHRPSSEWVRTQQPQTVRLVFLDHTTVEGVVDFTCLATSTATEPVNLERKLNCPIDSYHEP